MWWINVVISQINQRIVGCLESIKLHYHVLKETNGDLIRVFNERIWESVKLRFASFKSCFRVFQFLHGLYISSLNILQKIWNKHSCFVPVLLFIFQKQVPGLAKLGRTNRKLAARSVPSRKDWRNSLSTLQVELFYILVAFLLRIFSMKGILRHDCYNVYSTIFLLGPKQQLYFLCVPVSQREKHQFRGFHM